MTTSSATTTRRASVRKAPLPYQFTGDELPREVRCEYPSKFCNNHKALKTKGGMHKFCEVHRRKANLNQKRWQQRRREMREQREQGRLLPIESPVSETTEVDFARSAAATPPPKLKFSDTELVALSPTDVIEPFPISDFTTTPPANGRGTQVMMLPTMDAMEEFSPNVASATDFPLEEDLDMLTALFFSDTQSNSQSLYNWHAAGFDAASSAYTLTGPSAAIV
jgi:hypothetical protein